jgi:hypothetical protein
VLYRAKDERNILQTIQRKKANWIGHILLRNCLLKHIIEGQIEERIEVKGRRGRRRRSYWMNLRKMRGYCKLKKEASERIGWRTDFGRGSKTDCGMNE